ncbi:F22C12.10 [Thalictrum thalictroides]|uniref:F22C12.10 n=1 Tax=Thalictrum thalictroides TaxID=46969 RepID=A0A7J6W3M9_THATH|nr:F22C12.10 [Thalictrum thalictroides]
MRRGMQLGEVGLNYRADTDLRLKLPNASISHFSTLKGIKRKWTAVDSTIGPEDNCSLTLELGHPVSSLSSMVDSATASATVSSAKETTQDSSTDLGLDFNLHFRNEKYMKPKKSVKGIPRPTVDLELSLSTVPAESSLTTWGSISFQNNLETALSVSRVPKVDKGSTSSPWKLGSAVSQWNLLHRAHNTFAFNQVSNDVDPLVAVSYHSPTLVGASKSSINFAPGLAQLPQRNTNTNTKLCRFDGCGKGARGSSGLCIAHGGGRRCQKVGCHKGAEGRTAYCKAHGGGRRCQYLGCTKSSEGRTDYCIAHGGGRRCNHEGCTRAARGKSGLCIRHGGGKRCRMENCTRSAEGLSGLCISHGGGRRCQFPECTKGAQGSTMLCKAHGGGKRCTALGCSKGAEGSTPFCKGHGGGKRCSFQGGGLCPKSVHGGTLFCVAHGGGKRCAMPDCTKSARGRTDFCVRHGGGKRCKFEGCIKSAQGSTDFCKAHGGGKRCTWAQLDSMFGNQAAAPCDRMARGKTGLCTPHSALVQDEQVHGGGTLGPTAQDVKPIKLEKFKDVVIVEDTPVDVMKTSRMVNINRYKQSSLLQFPPVVHMPNRKETLLPGQPPIPEGRVHGGNLMAMLANNNV